MFIDLYSKESNYEFKFYASGRKDVSMLLCDFILKKRYNIFHRFFNTDIIKIHITTDLRVPFIMCINDKKQVRTIKKKHLDIGFFTEYYPDELNSEDLGLQTEDLALYRLVFKDSYLKSKFNAIEKNLIWLYISDRKQLSVFETQIIATFKLTGKSDDALKQIEFLHELIEKLKTLKITNRVS